MMSKSCTPQSRYIPPDTATYSGVGGSGSSVVERIVLIQPSSPLSTAFFAAAIAASERRGNLRGLRPQQPDLPRHRRALEATQQFCAIGAVGPHGLLAQRRQACLDAGGDEFRVGVGPCRDDHAIEVGAEQRV